MKHINPKNLATNLALMIAALFLTFLVLEVGVRLLVETREFGPIRVMGVDPELPIRFLPNTEHTYETSEFRFTVRFNRFGRRDDEWTTEEIEDPSNLLFVGDSFVLGNSVEDEATIPTLLESWMAERGLEREVFNFGMPAGMPNTYLLLLEHALETGFAANTLIVGIFVGNDFYPDAVREDPVIQPRERAPLKPPPWYQSRLLRFLKLRLTTSATVVGWALTLGPMLGIDVYDTTGSYIFLRNPTPEQGLMFDQILRFFGRIQELADKEGRELRLVVFPNRIQVENREELTSRVFDASRPNDRIMEYCRSQDIVCLDLLPVLAERYESDREPLYFPIDRHMNERGTQVSSEAIGAFLEETGVLR